MGLVTAPRFCGSNPPHTWVSLHLRISQVLCGCPCALPMDDSFVHRRSVMWSSMYFAHGRLFCSYMVYLNIWLKAFGRSIWTNMRCNFHYTIKFKKIPLNQEMLKAKQQITRERHNWFLSNINQCPKGRPKVARKGKKILITINFRVQKESLGGWEIKSLDQLRKQITG